jgi:hypothetical protein
MKGVGSIGGSPARYLYRQNSGSVCDLLVSTPIHPLSSRIFSSTSLGDGFSGILTFHSSLLPSSHNKFQKRKNSQKLDFSKITKEIVKPTGQVKNLFFSHFWGDNPRK